MFREVVTYLTIVCFTVTLFGCYSQEDISTQDLSVKERRISEVVTTNGEVLIFREVGGHYAQLVDSTIAGTLQDGRPTVIPLSRVARVSVMRIDAAKSILWTVGGIAIAGVVVLGIIAATKQSCPFVYSYNGEKYVFDGEPYGGAICEALERTDWCRLEYLRPESNEYRLLLTNEVDETQYTDEFKLWIVDHQPGIDVVLDSDGSLFTVDRPVPPLRVVDGRGRDLAVWLSVKDKVFWESHVNAVGPHHVAGLRDSLYLTFPRPRGESRAKLVVSASTTLWGSQMLKRMTELRGEEIPAWFNELKSPSARQMLDVWNKREELYHLMVKVRIGSTWVTRGDILGGGPFMTEDRIVPLDLSGVDGDVLQILLTPPAGFWQLNSFGLDYSTDEPVNLREISAVEAVGHDGADLLGTLDSTDGKYYVAPEKGQAATLVFRVPPAEPGSERTVFAKVSGYYDIRMKAEGPAQREVLNRIAFEPGYPVKFSLEEFSKWKAELAKSNQPHTGGTE